MSAPLPSPPLIGPAPIREPIFDRSGKLSRPWLIWFSQLFQGGVVLTAIQQSVTDGTLASAFEERNPRDYSRAIQDARLNAQESTPRNFTPAIAAAETLARPSERSQVTRREFQDLQLFIAYQDTPRKASTGAAYTPFNQSISVNGTVMSDDYSITVNAVPVTVNGTPIPL
jgi:hypothetical protein